MLDNSINTQEKKYRRPTKKKLAFIIRLTVLITFLLCLAISTICSTETDRLIWLILASIIGLMMPSVLNITILKSFSCYARLGSAVTKPFIWLINKTHIFNLPYIKSSAELTSKDEWYLISFISSCIICAALLLISFNILTDSNYRNVISTLISVLYGASISQYSQPLLKVVAMDMHVHISNHQDKNKNDNESSK